MTATRWCRPMSASATAVMLRKHGDVGPDASRSAAADHQLRAGGREHDHGPMLVAPVSKLDRAVVQSKPSGMSPPSSPARMAVAELVAQRERVVERRARRGSGGPRRPRVTASGGRADHVDRHDRVVVAVARATLAGDQSMTTLGARRSARGTHGGVTGRVAGCRARRRRSGGRAGRSRPAASPPAGCCTGARPARSG